MRKKVGTPVSGSRELKLFEPVAVEFMFQELEFHIPHAQTSSYHIYERDSAGDEGLRLGSEAEVLYLLISTCSSVIGSNRSFTLAAHFRVIPFFRRMVLSSAML